MKYAIIIPDGAADLPIEELGGKTAFQAANIPNIDSIAAQGRCGTTCNVPKGMPAGSDVAILSLLGYDPCKYYTGRAPLEAAAQGLEVHPEDWIFRCNLVTIIDGIMEDYSAGHIRSSEASQLIQTLNEKATAPNVRFYPGVGYRHLMTYRGDFDVETIPPHDILGQQVPKFLPKGKGADMLLAIMKQAHELLEKHDINKVRADLGENTANSIWLWGQGKMPNLPSFGELYGKTGATITAVDLVRGVSKLIGWDLIPVEGATGYLDTNYQGKGVAAVRALDKYDIVCVHVEATDEAGHNADATGKVQALEQIDEHIVGPVLERLKAEGDDWRVLILPDHPTPCQFRTHTSEPVPFAIAGKDMSGVIDQPFNEITASDADLHISQGCELMEFFLTVR